MKTRFSNFVLAISQLIQHRNLKILVPSLHNTLAIMWGRDNNFQVLMRFELFGLSIPSIIEGVRVVICVLLSGDYISLNL